MNADSSRAGSWSEPTALCDACIPHCISTCVSKKRSAHEIKGKPQARTHLFLRPLHLAPPNAWAHLRKPQGQAQKRQRK
jgi:hypothetical protein